MRFWERLSRRFKRGTPSGELVLGTAYRDVFSGNSSQSQRQIVLADLAANCGWNQVTLPENTEQRIWFNEGKRAAFALIFTHLSLGPADVEAFENAVRHEAVSTNQ